MVLARNLLVPAARAVEHQANSAKMRACCFVKPTRMQFFQHNPSTAAKSNDVCVEIVCPPPTPPPGANVNQVAGNGKVHEIETFNRYSPLQA